MNFPMKRVVIPELLDTDAGTSGEIAASLSDLSGINRSFGGVSTAEALIENCAHAQKLSSFSMLEVAAGSGEVPRIVSQRLRMRGIDLRTTLLDRAYSHLNGHTQAVVGDALMLPFDQGSFDLVSCTLFAHHLSPEELVQFASEALRVCRQAVLVNDIVRNPLHLALVYAACPLFRSRLTRHDAPVSVRRAYTPDEVYAMLKQTSAARIEITRHYLFRMGVTIWKH
jgi:ubiquinone/menaquinone biosynthesis C-methylase UbiE